MITADENSTPAETRVFESFDEAIRVQRLPFENHAMMRRIIDHIPIARFEARKDGGVRGVRASGGHDLKFMAGYVTGFESEAEGEAASGTKCWSNSKTGVNWMIWLSANGSRSGGGTSAAKNRPEPKRCPHCGNEMPATGICDFCG